MPAEGPLSGRRRRQRGRLGTSGALRAGTDRTGETCSPLLQVQNPAQASGVAGLTGNETPQHLPRTGCFLTAAAPRPTGASAAGAVASGSATDNSHWWGTLRASSEVLGESVDTLPAGSLGVMRCQPSAPCLCISEAELIRRWAWLLEHALPRPFRANCVPCRHGTCLSQKARPTCSCCGHSVPFQPDGSVVYNAHPFWQVRAPLQTLENASFQQ